MIATLTGVIAHSAKNQLVLQTSGGVGYAITVLPSQMFREEDTITLYTYLKVSENAMELYGFQKEEERAFFQLFLSVAGIGPKTAMNILGLGTLSHIAAGIARGDIPYLTQVQGMGKKTAERLVVELKSKIREMASDSAEVQDGRESLPDHMVRDILDSLESLGYTRAFARDVLERVSYQGETTEAFLKSILQKI